MRAAWITLVVIAGCGDDTGPATTDAHAIDAPAAIDASAGGGNALAQVLYVDAEGVTLVGGVVDDATANKTTLTSMTKAVRGWRTGDAGRQARIDAVVGELRTILAPYEVDIVTTRPAAGPYDMLVVTDDGPQSIGLPAGVGAVTPTSCNGVPSVISIFFAGQFAAQPEESLRHTITGNGISMFGVEAGIPVSAVAQDCMCLAAQACNAALTGPCHIGGPGTMVDPNNPCGTTGPTMDEGAQFVAAFGAR